MIRDLTKIKADAKAALRLESVIAADGYTLIPVGRNLKCCCMFHHENTASFNINVGDQYFRCFGCGVSGDVFTWISWTQFKLLNPTGAQFVEVVKIACNCAGIEFPGTCRLNTKPPPIIAKVSPKPPPPPRNTDAECARAREFAEDLEHNPAALEFLWRTRGITEEAAICWGVGITDIRRDATGNIIACTWTFPIFSPEPPYRLIGVKLHRQNPPKGVQKGGWLVKGSAALFPLLEALHLPAGSTIILVPGELKALLYLSAGIPAVSITTGETTSLNTLRLLAPRFAGLVVKVDPDREDTKVAREFAVNAATALLSKASSIEVYQ